MNFMVEDVYLLNFTMEWPYHLISKMFISHGYVWITANL